MTELRQVILSKKHFKSTNKRPKPTSTASSPSSTPPRAKRRDSQSITYNMQQMKSELMPEVSLRNQPYHQQQQYLNQTSVDSNYKNNNVISSHFRTSTNQNNPQMVSLNNLSIAPQKIDLTGERFQSVGHMKPIMNNNLHHNNTSTGNKWLQE